MNIPEIDLNILKNILSNKKYAVEFVQSETEKIFIPDLWRFAKLIIDYIKIYKDTPTQKIIIDKIKTSKNDALCEYVAKIYDRINNFTGSEKEYKHDLEKIKARYQKDLLIDLQKSLNNDETNLPKKINEIQKTLSTIKSVDSKRIYDQASLREGIDSFLERLKARKENPKIEQGIFTGYTNFDYITNGLSSPEYVIIAGSTGQGKSTLLLSMAAQMYMQNNSIDNEKFTGEGKSVLFFSLEMPLKECQDRLISCISGVPFRSIKNAQLTDNQIDKLNKTLKFIKNYPYDFEIADIPRGANSNQLETIYNDLCDRKNKPDVVAVDYLNIMDHDDDNIEDWLRQEMISEDLWTFIRVNNLVLLTGVQLNEVKPEKTTEQQIGLHRIGRAKGIMKPCTIGIQLEKRLGEENYPTINCHIIKNRKGPQGKFTLRKNFECCAFVNDINYNEQGLNTGDISNALEKIEMENKE